MLSGTFRIPFGIRISPKWSIRSGTPWGPEVSGDINADGHQDMVVTGHYELFSGSRGIYVFLGNGNATFKRMPTYQPGSKLLIC